VIITLVPRIAVAAQIAPHADGAVIVVLILLGALVYGAVYSVSVRMHPWRPCRRCGESGKHRGSLFSRSFRPCSRCGGTGRELRRFARLP
jgi:DnaJ-class molecular chaperone